MEQQTNKIGVWRLSNHRFTILVEVNADCKILSAAPIAKRFVGRRFEEVCRWMQHLGETDIILMRVKQ